MELPSLSSTSRASLPLVLHPHLEEDPPMANFQPPQPPVPEQPAPPPAAADDDREALLRDPELLAALTKYIRRRVPQSEVEDVLQETLAAIALAPTLPENPTERRKVIFGIASHKVTDYHRGVRRSPDRKDGADVDVETVAHAVAGDPLTSRNFLARLVDLLPHGQLETFTWLARHLMGDSIADIAREADLDYELVKKRVSRLQRSVTAVAQTLTVLVVIGVVGGIYDRLRKPPQMAHDDPPMPTERPAVSTPEPEPSPAPSESPSSPPVYLDPHERARQLREQAFRECVDNKWVECAEDLQTAKDLDPAGDNDPRIKAARKDALEGIQHMEDKYDTGWRPPRVRLYGPKP